MDKKILTVSSCILKLAGIIELLLGVVVLYLFTKFDDAITTILIIIISIIILFVPSILAGFKTPKYLEGKIRYSTCMILNIVGLITEYIFILSFGRYIYYPYFQIIILVFIISPLIINIIEIRNVEKLRNPHRGVKK